MYRQKMWKIQQNTDAYKPRLIHCLKTASYKGFGHLFWKKCVCFRKEIEELKQQLAQIKQSYEEQISSIKVFSIF